MIEVDYLVLDLVSTLTAWRLNLVLDRVLLLSKPLDCSGYECVEEDGP